MQVTVDADILIWARRGVCTPGQEELIERSKALLDFFDRHRHHLVLTSQAVAEYLTDCDDREDEYEVLNKEFQILPYDARAARTAARIRSDKEFFRDMKDEYKLRQRCFRQDIIIAATAAAHGVNRLYSNDDGLQKLARRAEFEGYGIPTLEALRPAPPPPKGKPEKSKESLPSLFEMGELGEDDAPPF